MRSALVVVVALFCFFTVPDVIAQDSASPALSLSDLDALIAQDEAPQPTLDQSGIVDLTILVAFLSLAVLSFLMKSKTLKYVTMVSAVVYMGFMKGNLVSVVHLFALMEWSFPLFQYNIAWYVLMGFTVVSTVLWGRLYCGRICAFGSLTQLMDRILPSRWRVELPPWIDRRAIYVKYVLLVAVLAYFLVTKDTLVYRYVEPFWMFTLSGSTVMWSLLAALLLTTVFIRNFYCRYLCIVGAGLGLLSNLTVFGIKRWQQCNTCKLCDKECEWGAIQGPKISVSECVRCDDCEILCNDKARCPHWLMIGKKEAKREIPKAP
jgi:NosR/NirI family transcriptional regulator, nitrous oxide reductase regulator